MRIWRFNMDNGELVLKHEIEHVFGIQGKEINEFKNLEGSNPVYSFIVKNQEYLRLFSFLALDSFALMAWCVYENPEDYGYYLNFARKYSKLVLDYYKDII
jgi:hypothetical protein